MKGQNDAFPIPLVHAVHRLGACRPPGLGLGPGFSRRPGPGPNDPGSGLRQIQWQAECRRRQW